MKDKKRASLLRFPLQQVTEIDIRAIDHKGAWLSLKQDSSCSLFLDPIQFQKAVQDVHGYFYYAEGDRRMEMEIEEFLPPGFRCDGGQVYDMDSSPLPERPNHWPLLLFLFIMFGGLLM
ncbi:MAG: hypothetical protein FWF59_09450 [Turicibacter sp.]|nr:hypothetical protein [Turicibacter sp.]